MRIDPFAEDALSRDDFLGGRVRLWQPVQGYRAGIDPVLLAASVAAKPGQSVLELGCGAGPALCCLGVRVPGLRLSGIEIQPAYAALARRNLAENGLDGTIWEGDLSAPPPAMRAESFDIVIANPPYFDAARRTAAPDPDRELAMAGQTPLADWIACAARRLKPFGHLHVILNAERLPDLMAALLPRLGSLELWPLAPRDGRAPRLVLMRARKEGAAPFRFHPALVLHRGARHPGDRDHYTETVQAVMRDAAGLPFPA